MGNHCTPSDRPRAGFDRIKGAFITPYQDQTLPAETQPAAPLDTAKKLPSPGFLIIVCICAAAVGTIFSLTSTVNTGTAISTAPGSRSGQPITPDPIAETRLDPVSVAITVVSDNERLSMDLPLTLSRPGNKSVIIEFDKPFNLSEANLLLAFDVKPQAVTVVARDASFTSNARAPLTFSHDSFTAEHLLLTGKSFASLLDFNIHRITELRVSFEPAQPITIKNVYRSYQEPVLLAENK